MSTTKRERPATEVTTGKVRLSFANLFKAKAIQDGQTPKFSTSIIIPKSDTKTLAAIEAGIKAAIEDGKAKLLGKDKVLPKNLKTPLRDGDEEKPSDPAYKDAYFMNLNSTQKPPVVDLERNEITDPLAIKSGDYARVNLNFYAFNTNGNRGIACGLRGVQLIEEGGALGNVIDVEAAFGEWSDEDDI